MMGRSQAELRHHRERVIANRLRIIRDVFGGRYGLQHRGPGQLHKDHLCQCSCVVCGGFHYRDERAKRNRYDVEEA
jgi:hypothetical protein